MLLRVNGEASIGESQFPLLFIPLSIDAGPDIAAPGKLQVADEIVEPGTYITVTGSLDLKGTIDFLLVRLP
jgi:hypothetical protein